MTLSMDQQIEMCIKNGIQSAILLRICDKVGVDKLELKELISLAVDVVSGEIIKQSEDAMRDVPESMASMAEILGYDHGEQMNNIRTIANRVKSDVFKAMEVEL